MKTHVTHSSFDHVRRHFCDCGTSRSPGNRCLFELIFFYGVGTVATTSLDATLRLPPLPTDLTT